MTTENECRVALEPCPFCGARPEIIVLGREDYACCTNKACEVQPSSTPAAWNRRPAATAEGGEAVAWQKAAYPEQVTSNKVIAECWSEEGWEIIDLYTRPQAQPSIGVAEGWRPIETAPKDGTVILALQCWIFHTDAARRPHYVLHEVFFNDEGGWEIVEDGEILDDDSLSHWLPRDRLSAAPVSQEVGK